MIDIHSHIIYGVDDGAPTINDSIKMIEEEIKQGVTKIICTPHYRHSMFLTDKKTIEEHFSELKKEIEKRNLNIELYLGREIFFDKNTINLIKENEIVSLNNKGYYLLEFSYTLDTEIDEIVYKFKRLGYQVIIAHIERYQYIEDIEYVYSLKDLGALIQINASTLCGVNGKKELKKVLKYIKEGLVDFVSSDIHYNRINYMKEAYSIVKKKFGIDTANDLFNDNAEHILIS